MEDEIYDYTAGLLICGTTYSGTFTTSVEPFMEKKRKCFSFKSMRETHSDFIINKEEWAKFLEFVGATQTDNPCDQQLTK